MPQGLYFCIHCRQCLDLISYIAYPINSPLNPHLIDDALIKAFN
jgi:hypothetical protein